MNVLLLTADGLAAHWLGCYGNEWVTTPHLNRLAAEGVVHDAHHAQLPTAEGASLVWPPKPQVNGRCLLMPQATGPTAWCPDMLLASKPVLALDDISIAVEECQAQPASWLVACGVDWLLPPWRLARRSVAPYFGVDAITDAGVPLQPLLDPPEGTLPTDETGDLLFQCVQHSYAAAVSRFDRLVGRVYQMLDGFAQLERTAIVVTSGYGLSLGEHGQIGQPELHTACVHVPLVIRLPHAVEAGRHVTALTTTNDLPATILGLLQGDPRHGLIPLWHGEPGGHATVCFGPLDGVRALRTPERFVTLAADGTGQLFVKPEDRWEVNDLRLKHLDEAEQLEAELCRLNPVEAV